MEKLKSLSLSDLLGGDVPKSGTVDLSVSFKYVAPTMTDEEKRRRIADFQGKWASASAQMSGSNHEILLSGSGSSSSPPPSSKPSSHTCPPSPFYAHYTSGRMRPNGLPYHRNQRVFFAEPKYRISPSSFEVPDEFYEVNDDDSTRYSVAVHEAANTGSTKATIVEIPSDEPDVEGESEKERETNKKEKTKKKYTTAKIRVRLPNRIFLQGDFLATETIADLKEFVREALRSETIPFRLFLNLPRKNLTDRSETLQAAGLVPAAIVNFSSEDVPSLSLSQLDTAKAQEAMWYLREEVRERVVILKDEYTSESSKRESDLKCALCGLPDTKSRCGKCKWASYCGRECQKKHWKTHKSVCEPNRPQLPKKEKVTEPVKRKEDLIDTVSS